MEHIQKRKKKAQGYIEGKGLRALPHNIGYDFKKNKLIYLMSLPIVIWFIIFCYVPMGGILMAFEKYSPVKGIIGSDWVGFGNFRAFFQGPYFLRLMKNTVVLGVLDLIVGFPAPIIFALLLNEITTKKFKKTVQTISYMPYFISSVVLCGLITDFCASGGVLSNLVAGVTNSGGRNLLGISSYFRPIFVLSNLWQGLGYGSIIYIASLSSVDQELYEAAVMDGANRIKQTIHITLPGIAPTIIIMLILRISTLLQVSSDKILLLYNPSIYKTADVINTYVYREGLQNYNYGLSSAVGLFNSLIATALLLITNKISAKCSDTSLF
ncbi:ABC transporter permease [Lachnoclostridium phytofermentans]|uniref:Binding-protein-dependent transport systems inner membrane component n=1 Tax=Lachnoclostridium phytofermentans (strain ATCC 700394 / DSM 18823 / ISDg) TaxID=357809 RepID=A9KJP6_LACP7|nr:ABC transporter permease subunit [Lachnoclostridium phytofermentans]ABX41051.1 binding-protein-dependent transport systems inner membrane component [Lachnoclostridium phytofermentans ISDg]